MRLLSSPYPQPPHTYVGPYTNTQVPTSQAKIKKKSLEYITTNLKKKLNYHCVEILSLVSGPRYYTKKTSDVKTINEPTYFGRVEITPFFGVF